MKGQVRLVDSGIGVMVAMITVGAVALPIMSDVTRSINATSSATIQVLSWMPIALAFAMFVGALAFVRTPGSSSDKSFLQAVQEELEKEDEQRSGEESDTGKSGIKILGYRVKW